MQIILSGTESNIFAIDVELNSSDEIDEFEKTDDIFSWLSKTGRDEARGELTARMAFKAVLEDMITCIIEATECARKGRLVPAFILLRKPIQENLILLEEIAISKQGFASTFENARNRLQKEGYGGVNKHAERINSVLCILGLEEVFDAQYIAELRYEKKSYDSFDGICNQAMHLFTSKEPIQTESMNINLVFSGDAEKESQARYFFSRLPYILIYIMELLDCAVESIAPTHSDYLAYQRRRVFSLFLMGMQSCGDRHEEDRLNKLFIYAAAWLEHDCESNHRRKPEPEDLERMSILGCYPDDDEEKAKARLDFFKEFNSAGV